ncbi:alpha/beta hydrolase [Lentilactobacillus senioris]|uniref:alpha/beta hydrolase n=1 Tax=Lentilactobacillus senioris TaxID=931534 RepID=UPI00227F31FA|nr:alpha/beta fold hydrolase [Lentilactobacillus senioris]MCY9807214.1 alpha/beta hydrolase [Lentilactobacillus senioris]
MISRPEPFYFKHGPQGIILLHAFASNPNDVRLLARQLERLNYSVYAPMLTGHGTGDFTDILVNANPQIWQADVQKAIEFMQAEQMESISIFGISLGGIFATWALEHNPQLLMGGAFGSPIVSDDNFNVHSTFMQMAKADYQQQKLAQPLMEEKLAWLDSHVDEQLAAIAQFTHEVADQLGAIKQPYFIAQGTKDEIINPDSGKRLAAALAEHNFQFHEYDAGHMLTVNGAHHQLEADLISFLKENNK